VIATIESLKAVRWLHGELTGRFLALDAPNVFGYIHGCSPATQPNT
jgi:hypothetical protein